MPFIGRDWRSPGEAWVKTETLGWQRMKIIESQLHIPSSCHQNPACSWPPRSEFGKHMEINCNNNKTSHHDRLKRNTSAFGGSLSSENSSDESTSTSPTGSPEKNNANTIVASHHPIIISSPYGTQYKCCAHHHCHSSQSSSKSPSPQINCDLAQSRSPILLCPMSRSLSPGMIETSNKSQGKLKYNNTVADFRSSSACETAASLRQDVELSPDSSTYRDQVNGNENDTSPSRLDSASPPILLRNGAKLEDNGHDYVDQIASNHDSDHSNRRAEVRADSVDNNNCCCCNKGGCGRLTPNSCGNNIYQAKDPYVKNAPHCRISVRTKEVAMYNTISEAFYRLDFCNAIHDIRRFNYICKLLHLLITQNLTSLSGCATRVLFSMLEQVAWEVSSNKRNIHVIRNLLNELRQMIEKYYCWGRPIGSSALWQQHFDTIERISRIVDGIELSPPDDGQKQTRFDNLPVEMIREILLRLNDYRDLVNSAQASPVMRTMVDSQLIWKRLCRYHFTEQQLKIAFTNNRDIPLIKKGSQRSNTTKYARTALADGKGSFRNPVGQVGPSNSKGLSSASSKGPHSATTRQQLEQTSQRRNPARVRDGTGKRTSISAQTSSSRPQTVPSSTSYVTNTIRMFDNDGQTTGARNDQRRLSRDGSNAINLSDKTRPTGNNCTKENVDKTNITKAAPSFAGNRSAGSQEIDWERVFHQLRKCLFWKSFGHPCIQQDEQQGLEMHQSACSPDTCDCPSLVVRDQHRLPLHEQRQQQQQQYNSSGEPGEAQNRPSVALLSRNFDNRAQNGGGSSRSGSGSVVNENAGLHRPAPNESVAVGNQQQACRPRSIDNIRNHLGELNAQLNNHQPAQLRRGGGGAQIMVNNNNNINVNNNNNARRRNEELVPKHVTISPQAFLKFFSL